ncbi:MAG: helix-turn-helix domain-containing protein [Thermomicrobiales bacterium]
MVYTRRTNVYNCISIEERHDTAIRFTYIGEVTMPETARAPVQPLLMWTNEAAQLLGVSQALVYIWVREGRIPYVKIGKSLRIPRELLEEQIRTKTVRVAS